MKKVLEINRIGIFKVSLLYFLMFYHKFIFFSIFRELFITIRGCRPTKMTSIFKQERPCLNIFRIAFLLELTILQDLPRHEDRSRS